jgi:hypothetical protein
MFSLVKALQIHVEETQDAIIHVQTYIHTHTYMYVRV